MERDPLTNQQQAAAEQAAADAATEPGAGATDGVHAPAEPEPEAGVGAEATTADGASAPEASVEQARGDAAEPEAQAEPKAAEPDYRDQYLRAMAELDNVRKRAR